MKTRFYYLACLCLMQVVVKAQMKIGDNPTTINSASLLELETTNKGLVFPRVSLTNVTSSSPLPATLLTGTVVYNTNASVSGGNGVGLYYWGGAVWTSISSSAISTDWSLTGNSGLNASTNFIGTTDAIDFVARTANTERMRILGAASGSSKAGWVGIGVTIPRSSLDVAGHYSNKNVLTLQNTSTSGFSSVDMLDSLGNLKGTFGYANSGTGGLFAGKDYFNIYGNDFIFTTASTNYDFFMKGSNGFVGINTNSPSERLHVAGNLYLTGAFMPGGSAGTSGYVLTSAGAGTSPTWNNLNGLSWSLTGNSGTNYATNFLGTTDNVSMRFRTNNTLRMIIDSTGNAGIGLSNPSYRLSVLSSSNPLYLSGVQATSTFTADSLLTINAGVVKKAPYSSLTSSFWSLTGNSGTSYSTNFIGTTDNVGFRLRTNNIQRIIVDSLGDVGIGSSSFNATNRERLLVDYGTATSNTLATFRGGIDDFFQINLQNTSSGVNASTDYVATSNDGTDSTYYVDMGINSSAYAPGVENFGGPHDAYLYAASRNLLIGAASTNSDIIFLLGGGKIRNNAALRLNGADGNIIVGGGESSTTPAGNVVRGPNASASSTSIAGGSLTLQGGSATTTATGGSLNIYGGTSASGTAGAVNINTSNNSATNINTGTSTANTTIGSTGNNILLPKYSTAGGIFYTSLATGQISTTGSNMMWDSINNRLGIGIASPGYKLSVLSSSNPLYLSGVQATASFSTDSILTILNGVVKKAPYSSLPSGSSDWSLTGNSGTTAGTNFLGTTDAKDLVFKVNNTQAGYIGSNSGSSFPYTTALGISSNASSNYATAIGASASAVYQSTAIGYNAQATGSNSSLAVGYNSTASTQNSIAIGTSSVANGGNDAIAIGNGANANYTGAIAIGLGAKASNGVSKNYALALGANAIVTSYLGIAIGNSASASTNDNTMALGVSSTASGYQSMAVGNGASASASNSTAIGNGAATSQTNALILGNTSANVGIGTSTPNTNAKIDVDGNFKLGDVGTVNKTLMSFSSTLASTTVAAQYSTSTVAGTASVVTLNANTNYTDVTFSLPSTLSSSQAAVKISPNFDLPDDIVISFVKLTSTSQGKIRFMNFGTASRTFSGTLYITVTEF